MRTKILFSALLAVGITTGITGCGSDSVSSPAGAAKYTRVAPLAAQTAAITIEDPTGVASGPTVSVTSQPADINVSGTASFAAGVVTVKLTATNNVGRVISNMKGIVVAADSNLQGGTVTTSSGAVAEGDFVSFNEDTVTGYVKSVADEASADSADLGITTGSASDITLSVSFPTEDVSILVGGSFGSWGSNHNYFTVDSANATADFVHDGIAHAFNDYSAVAGFRASAASPDGTKFFLGTRQMPQVVVHDNVTGTSSHISIAREGRHGAIHGLTVSPDGAYLYASLLDGAHSAPWQQGGSNRVWLIKMRIDTMEEVAALELTTDAGGTERLQQLNIMADGTKGVAPLFYSGQVAVVNLANMTLDTMLDVTQVIKATATPPVSGSAGFKPRWAAISPDGAYVYVAHQFDNVNTTGLEGSLEVYNVADGTGEAVALANYAARAPRGLTFDANGRLYFLLDETDPLSIFTFTGDDYSMPTAEAEITGGTGADGFAFDPYGDYYYVMYNGTDVYKFDITDDTLVDTITGIGGSAYHVMSVSAY